jgi:hypothetical protein
VLLVTVALPADLPDGGQVDLRGLLPATMATHTNLTIACNTGCRNTVVSGDTYTPQPDQVQILKLASCGFLVMLPFQVPVTSRVQRP